MYRSQQRLLTVMAVLLIALVGVLTWIDAPAESDVDYIDAVSVRPDELTRLTLVRPDATIVAERTPGGWLLLEPLKARADDGSMAGFVGVVDRLDRKSVV